MVKFKYILLFAAGVLSSCSAKLAQITDIGDIDESLSTQAKENQEVSLNEVITPALSSIKQRQILLERNGFTFHGMEVPDEVMLQVFSELPVKDIAQASQVCKGWYELSGDPTLWKAVRLHIYEDYTGSQATKEQAKLHTLRVHMHTLTDLTKVEYLINKYNLNSNRPFVRCQNLSYQLIQELTREIIDEQAAQGNEAAIDAKIVALEDGEQGYEKGPEASCAYNEWLVGQGNEKAITRKAKGLANGWYGYKNDVDAAIAYNEHMVEEGNSKAIDKKVVWLYYEGYGYKKDPAMAFSLNEYWVGQGSRRAMERKIKGLALGIYGYKWDGEGAIVLNDHLIEQGSGKAIRRKIEWLVNGYCGYKRNVEAARILTEQLIAQGNEEAITIKIRGLSEGTSIIGLDLPLYQPDIAQLTSWLEEEESKGTRWARYLKAQGLKYGILGFAKDRGAAVEYIKRYNIPY
jgi:hypothetical protein